MRYALGHENDFAARGQAWPLMFSRANSVDSPWGLGDARAVEAVQPGYSAKL
jgi:hypothetical protein